MIWSLTLVGRTPYEVHFAGTTGQNGSYSVEVIKQMVDNLARDRHVERNHRAATNSCHRAIG